MQNNYTKLLLLIAGATQKELARQVQFLKIENQILRTKLPGRIPVTPQERNRLVRFGARLGKAIHELVTIVRPGTLLRWIREDRKSKHTKPVKVGRRPTAESIRKLILSWPGRTTGGTQSLIHITLLCDLLNNSGELFGGGQFRGIWGIGPTAAGSAELLEAIDFRLIGPENQSAAEAG